MASEQLEHFSKGSFDHTISLANAFYVFIFDWLFRVAIKNLQILNAFNQLIVQKSSWIIFFSLD